jgi:hypothetical protein
MDAALAMNWHGVGSVIVTVEGQPSGIVTRGDLLHFDGNIEDVLQHARCECCGLTRHLGTDETGATTCMYCRLSVEASVGVSVVEAGATVAIEPRMSPAVDARPLAS